MLARQTPETFEEAFDRISAERGGEVNQAVQQAAALASGTRVCLHCDSYGLTPDSERCSECGKRETDPRCDRCDDTGSYEVRSSQRFYTDVETVRCACVAVSA